MATDAVLSRGPATWMDPRPLPSVRRHARQHRHRRALRSRRVAALQRSKSLAAVSDEARCSPPQSYDSVLKPPIHNQHTNVQLDVCTVHGYGIPMRIPWEYMPYNWYEDVAVGQLSVFGLLVASALSAAARAVVAVSARW